VKLCINRCPAHGCWSVSVDSDHGGTRITSGKCCGRWDEVKSWPMTSAALHEAARVFEDAAEEAERSNGD